MRVGRQQGRRGVFFVQVFDDGHGLRELFAVDFEQRHQGVGGQGGVRRLLVFAFGDVHGDVVVAQALEFHRDAYTKRGRRAEIVVEFHLQSINDGPHARHFVYFARGGAAPAARQSRFW
jgi:hypothetical protein